MDIKQYDPLKDNDKLHDGKNSKAKETDNKNQKIIKNYKEEGKLNPHNAHIGNNRQC
ncbi:MAG: hypothetical protein GYA50_07290 [Eubacteriaceae bacterium]|nr:hypothetical protein [Eubacteriaceae bacterium]